MAMAKFLLAAAAFGSAAQAFAIEAAIAQPTDATRAYPTASLPEITEAPSMHELMRRADVMSVLVGPDNTCGYVSGRIGAVYTCGNPNAYCAFMTTAGVGAVACCDASNGCEISLDCLDYDQIYFSSACDNGCMNDIYTAKCSDAAYPYCGTIRFSSSITDYFCQSLSYSTAMDALTTYSGESDGRAFSEVAITLTSDFASATNTGGGGAVVTVTGGAASSSSVGSSSGSNSGSSGSGSGGSGSGSGSSTTNIGPIVGGAVGGAAILALIGFGIWFMLRRSRKNKAGAQPTPQQQQQPPYPPMQQNQPSQPGFESYNQGYGQQQPQPGQYPSPQQVSPQGYPPQAAYFPTQEKPAPTAVSVMSDSRLSMAPPTSPTSTISSFQPQHTGGYQQPVPNVPFTVHEAGGDAVGNFGPNSNHHGQFHELG